MSAFPTGSPVHISAAPDGDEDFDFQFAPTSSNFEGEEIITADQLFADGQIKPLYPVFGRYIDLSTAEEEVVRLPLDKLVLDDDGEIASSASSENEEFPLPDSYCVWSAPQSPEKYKKRSSSTGSSAEPRRWKLKDLIAVGRSKSDGKKKFTLVRPVNNFDEKSNKMMSGSTNLQADRVVENSKKGVAAAHRAFYGNKTDKAGLKGLFRLTGRSSSVLALAGHGGFRN